MVVDVLVDFIVQFGWEWVVVDVGGVGFGDVQYVVDCIGFYVGIGECVVNGGVGVGDVWVGVVVDVQQCVLGVFEQYVFILFVQVVQDVGDVGFYWFDVFVEGQGFVVGFLEVDCVGVEVFGQYEVVVVQCGVQEFFKLFGIVQVGDVDVVMCYFVFVCWVDVVVGGVDCFVVGSVFVCLVQGDVVWYDQWCGWGDFQV